MMWTGWARGSKLFAPGHCPPRPQVSVKRCIEVDSPMSACIVSKQLLLPRGFVAGAKIDNSSKKFFVANAGTFG